MAERTESAVLLSEDIEGLLSVGAALAAEHDLDRLLTQILGQCRKILRADAGSLFLAEGPTPDRPTHLRFKLAQNDSVPLDLKEFSIPINSASLVGFVAETGKSMALEDVYHLPPGLPFQFNPEFDKKTGYRSKSLLSVVMRDRHDQLIGVVQVWNKKRNITAKLTLANAESEVMPFSELDHRLLSSLAAQAGVAIENARLYSDIKRLFEGFIRASIKAIESRDPTTSGHSERVAVLTVGLAEEVDKLRSGRFADIHFTPDEFRQLNYAALLHDFGKIGIREQVLVKAKKLYPMELEMIHNRLDLLHRSIELDHSQRKLNHVLSGGVRGDFTWQTIESDEAARLKKIEIAYQLLEKSNEPTVLPEGISKDLANLGEMMVLHPKGTSVPLLTADQIYRLSIPKGSLSKEERLEIESHVSHTFQYLKQIPWTRELSGIPDIAHAHHEKLDGSGYPRGIHNEEIPLPSKIMAVADIFDALAARDRPYKKAVPVPRALDILKMETDDGKLDADLVQLFIQSRVYERTAQE